jgi:hypothetical protein
LLGAGGSAKRTMIRLHVRCDIEDILDGVGSLVVPWVGGVDNSVVLEVVVGFLFVFAWVEGSGDVGMTVRSSQHGLGCSGGCSSCVWVMWVLQVSGSFSGVALHNESTWVSKCCTLVASKVTVDVSETSLTIC